MISQSPLFASTQNEDVWGTCAFDGYESTPIGAVAELVTIPEEYMAIGFEIGRFTLDSDMHATSNLHLNVYAVNKRDLGLDRLTLEDAFRQSERIPVHRFTGSISPAQFNATFKRASVIAHLATLPREKFYLQS